MLLIDAHEPKEIIAEIRSRIPVSVIKLKYGDYSFSDTVIERKSLSDFFSSLKSGRLPEQMENISRFYADKYLVIEGFFDFEYVNNIEHLYSQLFHITHDFGVKVIFSKDERQTADFIRKLYFKGNLGSAVFAAKKGRIYHAASFFGVSRRKLEILYSHFGSILDIAKADRKEFKKVKGIGAKTQLKFKSVLSRNIFEDENK